MRSSNVFLRWFKAYLSLKSWGLSSRFKRLYIYMLNIRGRTTCTCGSVMTPHLPRAYDARAGKIHYNTTVNSISRADRTSTSGGSRSCAKPQHEGKEPVSSSNAASRHLPFELNLAKTDTPVVCGVVIIASGLSVPNVPSSMSGKYHF